MLGKMKTSLRKAVVVHLTEDMIRLAKEFKRERDKTKNEEGFTYDKFTTPDDAFVGRLGELAFEEYLEKKGLKKGVNFVDNSREEFYDKFDFKLTQSGKKIDVKAAQTELDPNYSWYFGYPEIQKPAKKDVIVLVYIILKKRIAIIVGYLTGKQVSEYPVTDHNTKANFRYQTPNHDTPVKDYEPIDTFDWV